MLERAIDKGLPAEYHAELRSLIFSFSDSFRTTLGDDSPVSVRPMVIRLKNGAIPVQAAVRRSSPPQLEFNRKKVAELK